jgi:hypothetical protein
MTYSFDALSRVVACNSGGSCWYYESADTLTVMLAANYFNSAAKVVQAGDVIMLVGATELGVVNVVSNNGTTVVVAPPAAFGNAVSTAVGITLAASHNNDRIVVTAADQTITIPAATVLGFFSCEIYADGFAVILDGPGASDVTLADGELARVVTVGSKIAIIKSAATVVT